MRPSAVSNWLCHTLALHLFYLILIVKNLKALTTIDWSRSKNLELSSPWVPCVCQNLLLFYKGSPRFCGRWSFLAPGYSCLTILYVQRSSHQHNMWRLYAVWMYKMISGLPFVDSLIYWSNITFLPFFEGNLLYWKIVPRLIFGPESKEVGW
jgi:hypothetical protein